MSAVTACLHLDGRPMDARWMSAWTARRRQRGPDAQRTWVDGPVAIGHALFQTLPEDTPGRQPVTDATGVVTMALDGRVDNRDEVAALAGMRASAGTCDAALLAALLAARGTAALPMVVGDIAFVAWDARRRTLLAARDVFGLRPLAYRRIGDTLLVASDIAALVDDHSADVDEGFAGEVLAGRVTSRTATLYRGVVRLPPGQLMVASHDALRVETFTALTPGSSGVSRTEEAEEELRSLLRGAVAARMRTTGRAGVLLSGGIDSAAVLASVAAASRDTVHAWTADQRADASETTAAASVARHLGVAHRTAPAGAGRFDYVAEATAAAGVLLDPAAANGAGVRLAAAASDTRVLLAGVGGDEFLSTNRWHGADLLAGGRLWEWARFVRAQQQSAEPPGIGLLLQAAIVPLVPPALRSWGRLARGRATLPPWIDAGWAVRNHLADRLRADGPASDQPHAVLARLREVAGGASVWTHEQSDRMAVATGTEDRWPFFDRRLAEWALGLPPALAAAAPQRKAVLRQAFRRDLPAVSHHAVPPHSFEHVCLEALDALGGPSALTRLHIVEAGWVPRAWVADATARVWPLRGVSADLTMADALWHVLAVEAWLRQRHGRT